MPYATPKPGVATQHPDMAGAGPGQDQPQGWMPNLGLGTTLTQVLADMTSLVSGY